MPIHCIHHDLKSFFWVFWVYLVNCTGLFNQQVKSLSNLDPLSSKYKCLAGVPHWARLGLHTTAAYEVACDKINHVGSSISMGHISPYFAQYASITQGLQKLSALFTWQNHL